jgi:hypothetical protein
MDHWGQHLQVNSFTSEHQKGLKHTNTDVPSRRHYPVACPHCQKVEQQLDSLKVCCHHRLLGLYCAEEWVAEWWQCGAIFLVSGAWRTFWEEGHSRPQSHLQELTGRSGTPQWWKTTSTSMMFRRQICLPLHLLFGAAHQLCGGPHGTAAWHLWVCPSMTGGGHWQLPSQLHWIPSRRESKCGCIAWPRIRGSCLSCSHPGKTFTKWSLGSTMWYAGSSIIAEQRWWCYTWTGWHRYICVKTCTDLSI